MKPDWILVANASQARLLTHEPGSPMAVLQAFHHPESRMHSSELGDDARGRQDADRHYGGGSAYASRSDPKHREHMHFAKQLADFLEQGAQQGEFRHLQVFASSPFLGELKSQLGAATQHLLAGSHDLDLSAVGLSEMEARIRHALAPQA